MRQPLHLRLRPFLRRDLKARLVSAFVALFVVTGLSWLGVSALTKIDSAEGHALRVELGVEHPWAVCNGPTKPGCNYDDRHQERVDREFARQRALRVAVLDELDARASMAIDQLDAAEDLLRKMKTNPKTGALEGDTVALREALLASVVDLAPAPLGSVDARLSRLLGAFEGGIAVRPTDGAGWLPPRGTHRGKIFGNQKHEGVQGDKLMTEIRLERNNLRWVADSVQALRGRDGKPTTDASMSTRVDLVEELTPRGSESPVVFARQLEIAGWLSVRAHVDGLTAHAAGDRNAALMTTPASLIVSTEMPEVDANLARLARHDLEALHEAVTDPTAKIWQDGWVDQREAKAAITAPVTRYRSPVDSGTRWRLFGAAAFLFSAIMLVVVGPIVTATSTAREREAGTLPVLRMTGLSAGDLAAAMAVGPNVFALVSGLSLLAIATIVLTITAGPGALLLPLALLLALSAATHLTAIGLGDALGQRVNAMVVGGLLALGVLGPGLVGAVMVVGDMASTGLLLGPLPSVAGVTSELAGLSFGRLAMGGDYGSLILGYGVLIQCVLGGLCLLSWRRRVEHAWAPLFRPFEGALLALASVGCSAFTVLDLSARLDLQTYDTVNLVTAVATAFLMPVLGWLLVSSLVRPARASALVTVSEVRRAFFRFQLFLVLTFGALAASYLSVLHETGLDAEKSEVMWATLAQGFLVAETAVATLLWASRRRHGKHRVLVLGSAIALVQLVFAVAVYNLEVTHVAITQAASMPFMIGMDASPYWTAFMVVLWGAGLGLVLAAVMRERGDRDEAGASPQEDASDSDGHRYLH